MVFVSFHIHSNGIEHAMNFWRAFNTNFKVKTKLKKSRRRYQIDKEIFPFMVHITKLSHKKKEEIIRYKTLWFGKMPINSEWTRCLSNDGAFSYSVHCGFFLHFRVKLKFFLKMSQLYTLDEVKAHNGPNGARTWIVLHDNVYDVTDYLEDVS